MADNPTNAVKAGEEFFRLKREILTPGDIFEMDQAARAIYIGPQSDIAEVQVVYANPDEPLGLESAIVAVNGPLVGRVDALMAQKVSSTGQPSRILISPVDIVKSDYVRPTNAVGGPPKRTSNVPVLIDVMCALKTLPAIPEVRADKTFRFPQVPFEAPAGAAANDGSTDLVLPIYGRRMISVQIVSASGVSYIASFYGVALQPGLDTVPAFLGSYTQAGASIEITRNIVVRASQSIQGSVAPQTSPIDEVCGQTDLLVINIGPTGADPPPPATIEFVDVFVRVSDRET